MQERIEQARDRFYEAARRRRAKAMRLHEAGLTFAEIGKRFGVTRQRAQAIVKKAVTEGAGR